MINNGKRFCTFSREMEKEEYIFIKKHAINNGKRIITGSYYEKFSRDEETGQPLRVYEIPFIDEEGFEYSINCQFRDDICRIVTIYNIDDYLKPIRGNYYGGGDLHKICLEDEEIFGKLLKKLEIIQV